MVRGGGHFLEIGPGNLHLSIELLNFFELGTLIDYNPSVIEIYNQLKETRKNRLNLIIGDFNVISQPKRKYQCVIACEVLEHIKNDYLFLEKVFNLMDDQAQLIISVPARKKYFTRDDEIVGHYRRYDKKELIRKLSKSKFVEIKVISYGYPFVNILRLGRILLTKFRFNKSINLDQKSRSQKSASIAISTFSNLINIIINKYTFFPFNLISSLFNHMDLSDGYVVTANKK